MQNARKKVGMDDGLLLIFPAAPFAWMMDDCLLMIFSAFSVQYLRASAFISGSVPFTGKRWAWPTLPLKKSEILSPKS